MKYVVVKVVNAATIGAVVGPFKSKHIAEEYAEEAAKFSLGYENWVVKQLQTRANLVKTSARKP